MMSLTTKPAHFTPPAMKILKIFGVVVAIHVIAFIVIFANPGCRSTSSSKTEPAVAAVPAAYPGGDEYVPVTPVDMNEPINTPSPGIMLAYNSQTDGRSAPTRPGAVADATAEIIPASTYVVQRGDSLWSIARKNGITTAELASANNMQGSAILQIGQKLLVPSKGIAGSGPSSSPAGETKGYTVKSGDTLTTIASRHGTTIAAIRSANNLRSDIVRVGQELRIPDASGPSTQTSALQTISTPEPTSVSGTSVHVVKMGDTLGAISRRYKVSVADIAKANNITDPTKIRIGQELVIPGAGASTATAAAPAAQPQPAVPVQTVPVRASDLDAALPPDFIDAPVIQVEDPGAPKIE